VPKEFLREQKILNSNLKYTVPTELADDEAAQVEQVEAEPTELPPKSEQPFVPTPLPDSEEKGNGKITALPMRN
jgi:hypothetical protein